MEEKRNIDHPLQALWLAAGILAVTAASLERPAVKQWRSWVFIVLNILLLAILFISKRAAFFCTNSSENNNGAETCHRDDQETGVNNSKAEIRKNRIRKQPPCRRVVMADHLQNLKKMKSGGEAIIEDDEKIIECDDGNSTTGLPISKEELNERVEAFIATFRRQYLVTNITSGSYNSPASNSGGGISSKSITA